MIDKPKISPEQDQAANPLENVWVQANAGTGKTSVLTQRLLRILFRTPDMKKSGILCLTYTNAGAGEMRNRILRELKKWALLSNDDMRILLDGVAINKNITDDDIAHAREIFFTYIDNPDMLKIKTIHGFCEEVLHRFPIEAKLSPAWKLITDADTRVLLWDAFNEMMKSPNDENTLSAFTHIINRVSEYALDNLLQILSGHYKDFFGITNYNKYREYFIESTMEFLNIKTVPNMETPVAGLQKIVALTDVPDAKVHIRNVHDLTIKYLSGAIDFDTYKSAYLTDGGTKRVNLTKLDFLTDEQDRVFRINEYQQNKQVFDDTIALFDLSAAFAQSYMNIKRARNILDFEDLILYTRKLFADAEMMGWVLSQMDVSLSHILVDEAQDTSPQQWDIILQLMCNFFDEGDKTDLPRSLFVVGDTKQSIFGFQGADPMAFIRSRLDIARQIENNYRSICDVPLTQNFRSLPSVLYAVDTFFTDDTVRNISHFVNQSHKCFRNDKELGLVELYKLDAKQITEHDTKYYVKNIAQKIQQVLNSGKYTPQDIMVLVQSRNAFVAPLVFELKKLGVNVAGSDRIKLPQFPAIRDLLNLTRFCLDITDDYSLCCVLKSPLYRFSEKQIFELCNAKNNANRTNTDNGNTNQKTTVFDILKTYNPDVYNNLANITENAKHLAPYSFFSFVLRTDNNRQKMIAALGTQIIDPLEEFMTICLSYERTQSGTLREFLKWFITAGAEVKRDMGAATGVRIVTVHSSKGLESPVVFLIDTVDTPTVENIIPLPTENKTDFSQPWIWRTRGTAKTENIQSALTAQQELDLAEYYRLLYVAMTRARDELYIYGYTPHKNANPLSWHANLWRVFSQLYNAPDNAEYIRIQHDQPNN